MGALKTVMTVQALVLLVYGLPMLLAPGWWTKVTQQPALPENYVLRAVGIAFVVLAWLEWKIARDLERYQGLVVGYALLPGLFCVTIGLQALKRGFNGALWYWWLNGVVTAVFAIAVWAARRGARAA
ncbi:MAG TPA: hypothetical protein VFN71_05285 [Methylomirabilota bacterium]|nr:hypothetical protein [Methylomirabilota bacterium]